MLVDFVANENKLAQQLLEILLALVVYATFVFLCTSLDHLQTWGERGMIPPALDQDLS
jgi:hypothetical protein